MEQEFWRREKTMQDVCGALIVKFIGLVIGSLISAVILRAAAKWVEDLEIPYGEAYVTMLLSGVVNLIMGALVGFAVGFGTGSINAVQAAALLLVPVGFLIQSGFISSRHEVSFGSGFLISLLMIGIGLAIGLIIAIPLVLLILATR